MPTGGPQTAPGVPGSFPLPNAGAPGNAYTANRMHPSAVAAMAPRQNPANGGRPMLGGKK